MTDDIHDTDPAPPPEPPPWLDQAVAHGIAYLLQQQLLQPPPKPEADDE